jgi:hypothetical protein
VLCQCLASPNMSMTFVENAQPPSPTMVEVVGFYSRRTFLGSYESIVIQQPTPEVLEYTAIRSQLLICRADSLECLPASAGPIVNQSTLSWMLTDCQIALARIIPWISLLYSQLATSFTTSVSRCTETSWLGPSMRLDRLGIRSCHTGLMTKETH